MGGEIEFDKKVNFRSGNLKNCYKFISDLTRLVNGFYYFFKSTKKIKVMKAFLTAVFLFSFWFTAQCQVPMGDTRYRCSFCGKWFTSYSVGTAHLCSVHNYLCNNSSPVQTGPSPEQLKRMREEKDSKEAAEYANDKGIECYKKRDWNCAIKYFKEALDYNPDNDDADYNLKKANKEYTKEKDETVRKMLIEEKSVQFLRSAETEAKYSKYTKLVDNIVVPPPSWESMIAMKAQDLRIGHKKENYLLVGANTFVTALDIVSSTPTTTTGKVLSTAFKMLVIGAKSTIAAQQEAEIIVFTKNATYERMLMMLKDEKQGPQLVSIIKSFNENKPLPDNANPELVRLAKACKQDGQGTSSVHLVMNAMLSKEAKGAFLQTAEMEAMNIVSGWMRGKVGTVVQNRFKALKQVNEQINEGEKFLKQETDPLGKSLISAQLDKLNKKMEPFNKLPQHIYEMLSQFDEVKKAIKDK